MFCAFPFDISSVGSISLLIHDALWEVETASSGWGLHMFKVQLNSFEEKLEFSANQSVLRITQPGFRKNQSGFITKPTWVKY
jgi:hypothetical protein